MGEIARTNGWCAISPQEPSAHQRGNFAASCLNGSLSSNCKRVHASCRLCHLGDTKKSATASSTALESSSCRASAHVCVCCAVLRAQSVHIIYIYIYIHKYTYIYRDNHSSMQHKPRKQHVLVVSCSNTGSSWWCVLPHQQTHWTTRRHHHPQVRCFTTLYCCQ